MSQLSGILAPEQIHVHEFFMFKVAVIIFCFQCESLHLGTQSVVFFNSLCTLPHYRIIEASAESILSI